MEKSSCQLLLQLYPDVSEVEELRSTIVTNLVFNSFLSYTAVMFNIVTIHAMRKTSSLPKTLKTLLLSLAVSDVGVGLSVQPLYISFLVKLAQENDPGCNTYKAFFLVTRLFSMASFFGVVVVSLDRFLAIHLHLRYQELVTHKRVVAVVISIWLMSAFLSLMTLWVSFDIRNLISVLLGIVGLFLTTLVYIRIYLVVRRHKNQIHALQVQQVAQTHEMANRTRLVKSAVSVFYVYLLYLVCYLPFMISVKGPEIFGPSIAVKKCLLFSLTLVYLNSSLNPVIYCWKMRHIRHAIMDILQNMPWLRNRTDLSNGGHAMP